METIITLNDLYEFKRCSLRYKLTKVDKVRQTLNGSDGLREALHTTINYFYYNLQDGNLLGMEALKEKFSNIWYGDMDLYDIKINGDQTKRKKELEAIAMLHQLYRKQKYNKDKIVAVNLDFRVPFGENFIIKDSLPLVRETNQGYEIVVFKTGKQKYDEFWRKTDMAITLYAMAFEGIFKKQADRITVEALHTGKTFQVERSRKDYQRMYKSIRMMKKAMDEGWFYPNESVMCNTCPVKDLCMEWK